MTLTSLGIDAKMSKLATDPYERTTGMIFEYGHTVSHAIEKAYGDGVIPHGLGVTYGMLSSSYAAERMGIMSPEDRKEHDSLCWLLLKRWPLPEPRPTVERVMGFAMRDSNRGQQPLQVPLQIYFTVAVQSRLPTRSLNPASA